MVKPIDAVRELRGSFGGPFVTEGMVTNLSVRVEELSRQSGRMSCEVTNPASDVDLILGVGHRGVRGNRLVTIFVYGSSTLAGRYLIDYRADDQGGAAFGGDMVFSPWVGKAGPVEAEHAKRLMALLPEPEEQYRLAADELLTMEFECDPTLRV